MQLRKVKSFAPGHTASWKFTLRGFRLYFLFTIIYSFSVLQCSLVRWKILSILTTLVLAIRGASVNEMWMEMPYPNRGFNLIKISELSCSLQNYSQFELRYGNNLCPPMDEQIKKTQCMSMYNVILFSHEKEGSPVICNSMHRF